MAFVVGTAGHVDHGKTTLVHALTGVHTDRWKEERERGLTIDLGFAPLPLGEGIEASVVDVPGHEGFVKNMLAGATGIDLLLLVVASDEGPMPQTREHLAIARLLGVDHGVVALTKADRVDQEWIDLCRDAVREELVRILGHGEWPILPVSTVSGDGLERLRRAIAERAATLGEPDARDLFRLPVDRAFSVRGAGTVVTGTVWSGELRVGDEVRILPSGRTSRVRSLQVHSKARESVGPRRRCAVALVGVEAGAAQRGSVVVRGRAWREVWSLGSRLTVLGHSPRPIEHGQRIRVYLGTREVLARVRLHARGRGVDSLAAGAEGWAILQLEESLVARVGDRFVVRFYSPITTIGGGLVAEIEPPARWWDRVESWARILSRDGVGRVEAAVALRAGDGVETSEVPLLAGVSPGQLRDLEGSSQLEVVRFGDRWFSTPTLEEARTRVLEVLEDLHRVRPRAPGASREAVRSTVARSFAPSLVDNVLRELEASGHLVADGPELRLASHRPVLTSAEREARIRLLQQIEEGGLEPPTVGDLGSRLDVSDELLHDLLRLLLRDGALCSVSTDIYLSERNTVFLRKATERVFKDRSLATPTDFKEEFGVTRKYLIPLLEYLDRTGVTQRAGDGRVYTG